MTSIQFVEGYINMCRFMKERGTYQLFLYISFTSINRSISGLFKEFNRMEMNWEDFFNWSFLVGQKWPLYKDHNLIKVRNEWLNWMDERWIKVPLKRMIAFDLGRKLKFYQYE